MPVPWKLRTLLVGEGARLQGERLPAVAVGKWSIDEMVDEYTGRVDGYRALVQNRVYGLTPGEGVLFVFFLANGLKVEAKGVYAGPRAGSQFAGEELRFDAEALRAQGSD